MRRCGVFPDDPLRYTAANQPSADFGPLLHRSAEEGNHVVQRSNEANDHGNDDQQYDDSGKLLVFVDGSAYENKDWRRARAGWGDFIAKDHAQNAYGYLPDPKRTSYRGELAALAHAVVTIDQPIHVASDCRSIVDVAQSILLGILTRQCEGDD